MNNFPRWDERLVVHYNLIAVAEHSRQPSAMSLESWAKAGCPESKQIEIKMAAPNRFLIVSSSMPTICEKLELVRFIFYKIAPHFRPIWSFSLRRLWFPTLWWSQHVPTQYRCADNHWHT